MKSKALILLGAAVGYVLGARAGRARYEQIKARSRALARSPKVQDAVHQATDLVKDKAPNLIHQSTKPGDLLARDVVEQVKAESAQNGASVNRP